MWYKGEIVGSVTRYSDACLIFYLKGRRGDVFRERTELTGAGGGPVQTVDLTNVPTEQLEQMHTWLTAARRTDQVIDVDERVIHSETLHSPLAEARNRQDPRHETLPHAFAVGSRPSQPQCGTLVHKGNGRRRGRR